jgi:hypothetical protein
MLPWIGPLQNSFCSGFLQYTLAEFNERGFG